MRINWKIRIGAFLSVLWLFLIAGSFFGYLLDRNWAMLIFTTIVGVIVIPTQIQWIKEKFE